ncbi:MAG: hypothetical protein ACXVI6_09700 [Candidatus Aminicenantales bacterium]
MTKIHPAQGAAIALLLGALAIMSPGCGRPSEEARVVEFIKQTVASAQKRNLKAVLDRLADDYTDFEGRDKVATEGLLREYFRRTGIVIHLLSVKVDTIEPRGLAVLRVEAMLSSGAAEVFRKLIPYAGECYRLDVRLSKTPAGAWQIASAGWETIPLDGLFPDSLAILKKLFPDFSVK